MNNCTTCPPNLQFLRDDVIGNVILRTRASHSTADTISRHYQIHIVDADTRYCGSLEDTTHCSKSEKKRKRQSAENFLASKRQEIDSCTAESNVNPVTRFEDSWRIAMAKAEQITLREIRRNRQRRYRKRREDWKLTLEQDTQKLREEIQELERRYHDISPVNPTNDMWSVAVEYFCLFRGGVHSTDSTSSAQLDFVQATMAADVVFNGGRGAEAFVADWRQLSRFFPDFQLKLRNLEKDTENSLIATTTIKFTITDHTMLSLFLHPCSDKTESLEASAKINLVDILLNQQIEMPGTIRFVWDHGSRCMTSVVSRSDMLTPMLQLVGTVETLVRVVQHLHVFV